MSNIRNEAYRAWLFLQTYKHSKKMKFFIKDFFSKCDQIHIFLRI